MKELLTTTIVIVSLNYKGGIGSFLINYINELIKNHYNIIVVYISDEDVEDIKNNFKNKISYFKVVNKFKNIPYLLKGLNLNKLNKRIIKEYNLYGKNIIYHLHSYAALGIFHNYKNLKILVTLHGHMISTNFKKNITEILFKKNKNIRYISVSKETQKFYNDEFGIKSKVILNGTRVMSKRNNTKFTVAYIGTMDNHKGFKYLLDSIPYIPNESLIECKFVFAGNCCDNESIVKIKKYKDEGIDIEYLGQVNDAKNNLLPNISLVVLPSLMEGLPMILIEALAYGIPILGTEVGGIPEIIINGYNGYFIKRDSQDISKKIQLCFEQENYKNLSGNSLKIYNERFSLDLMIKKYINEISKI